MKKKLIALSLCLAMLAGAAAGCSGGGDTASTGGGDTASTAGETGGDEGGSGDGGSAEPTTLTFWNGFTSTDGDVLTEIVDRYNGENDKGVTIEMDIMTWDVFNEKLPAAISAGQAPDFVLCSTGYYPSYVNAGSFQDLSDYFDRDGNSRDDFDTAVLEGLTYGDDLIGIPFQVVTHYLFWDKDLFSAAGLDPESPPTNWDEIKEYAGKLTDASKNQFGWLIPTDNNVVAQYTMYAFGGDFTDEAGTTATLNSPENVEAFEWMYDVYVNMKASPLDSDDNTYISGQLGMFINGPWIINGLRENEINFGVTAVPMNEGIDPKSSMIPVGFSIPITTSDEHKELVYDFVEYWNTEDICTEWTERCGTPAYLKSAQENFADDPLTSVLSVPLEYGTVAMKQTGVTPVASQALYPALEEIFAGADIQQTLDKYNEVEQQVIDQMLEG